MPANPVAREFQNSIGMKFVLIDKGSFIMGRKPFKVGSDTNPHQVTLTSDFYMAVTEVTQSQFQAVMGGNPSFFHGKEIDGENPANYPVEQVNWHAASIFCEMLSSLPAEKDANRVYRLPTEAEWEYACRAGSSGHYCFGDDPQQLQEYAWFEDNSLNRTHPVALKKPNAWGLYDMHGNVTEWCDDWYDDYPPQDVINPAGASNGRLKVIRGGGFSFHWSTSSSWERGWGDPANNHMLRGFRVVCEMWQ